jgi:glyoxylase-like metal-dependent hydrolase (beta-lactamase superfamily II)
MTIHHIPVRETNCYLLRGAGGTVIIDPGPPGGADAVIAGATAAGIQPQDLRLILITHGHLDHYGAAPEVRAWCGAPVAAYPGEPAFSQDRRNALPPAQTLRGSLVRWFYLVLSPLAHFASLEADLLLEDGADLSPYGVDARTVLLPGHSPGSLGIVTNEADMLVGDLFVNYAVPSQPLYVSDRQAWDQSCQRVQALAPRRVYVGHGEPFSGEKLDNIYPARYQLRWWVR